MSVPSVAAIAPGIVAVVTGGRAASALPPLPGFTWTGMTAPRGREKPAGAWTPEQVVGLMMARVAVGDFYILCLDNETTPAQGAKRVAWPAGDVIENRPALSRWLPDWTDAFARFMAD